MNFQLSSTLQSLARRHHTTLYLVGGPVRDGVLGLECHDWDMVGRHAKKIARAAARKFGGAFIILDEQSQIYRVVTKDSLTLDFAELQGRTIEEDLARRDFTINAMAQRLDDPTVIDPFGGRRDLKGRVLRAVSKKVFDEDPLRLLRAFRFAAQFDLHIEPKTMAWIRKNPESLARVAAERIREEWLRLLTQPASTARLWDMDRAGVLTLLFPEIEACRRTAVSFYGRAGVLKHSLETVENLEWIFDRLRFTPDAIQQQVRDYLETRVGGYPRRAWLKWAGFLHDVGKPATVKKIKGRLRFFGHEEVGADIARRRVEALRCSRQESHEIALWVRHHMRLGSLAATAHASDKAIARYFRSLGDHGIGMLLVSLADHYTYLAKSKWGKNTDPVEKLMRRMLESYGLRKDAMLPARLVNGHQLMQALKLKPGPMIGKLLEAVQDAQTEGTVKTKEEAMAFAKRQLKSN